MPRVKRGLHHIKRRRNLMKRVKGFEAGRKNLIKLAKIAETKAGVHAYRDRRRKKREFRQLWQIRINAMTRELGTSYSKFMGGLKKQGVVLDRKVLSQIADQQPEIFKKLVEMVK